CKELLKGRNNENTTGDPVLADSFEHGPAEGELNKELDAAATKADIDDAEAKLKAYTVEHGWKNWQITSLYGAQVGKRINAMAKTRSSVTRQLAAKARTPRYLRNAQFASSSIFLLVSRQIFSIRPSLTM